MRRLAIPFLSLLVLLTVGVLAAPAKAPFPGRNGKIAFTFTVDFGDWDVYAVNPDGSEQRIIYGVPGRIASPDLTNPDIFEPTPWEAYTYDSNDNAGRTHAGASAGYQHHWDTPSSIVIDALGRTIEAVERSRNRQAAPIRLLALRI